MHAASVYHLAVIQLFVLGKADGSTIPPSRYPYVFHQRAVYSTSKLTFGICTIMYILYTTTHCITITFVYYNVTSSLHINRLQKLLESYGIRKHFTG